MLSIGSYRPRRMSFEASGPDLGGKWLVVAGDNPWKVARFYRPELSELETARAVRELFRANPQKPLNEDGSNFARFSAGELIEIPDSWRSDAGPTQEAPAEAEPAVEVSEDVADRPGIGGETLPPSVEEDSADRSLPVDVAYGKGLLVGWSNALRLGLADYGARLEDGVPSWGIRDRKQALAFQLWAGVDGTSDLTPELVAALEAWAGRSGMDGSHRNARGPVGGDLGPAPVADGGPVPVSYEPEVIEEQVIGPGFLAPRGAPPPSTVPAGNRQELLGLLGVGLACWAIEGDRR